VTEQEVQQLVDRVETFMIERVLPAEELNHEQLTKGERWDYSPIVAQLRREAKEQGLRLFPVDPSLGGLGLNLVEFAPIAERINWSNMGPDIFNCYSGTISNINTLSRYGSEAVKEQFLRPLLAGEARSTISITERDVPSSDPTELKFSIRRDGDHYVLNGRKSWATGAMHAKCTAILVLGATDPDAPRHQRHSLVVVPKGAPGLTLERLETVMGFDDAPFGHCDLIFDDVRVPVENRLGDEGAGFAIIQETLGLGRIQLGMGAVGAAERAMMEMCSWVEKRVIGGRPLVERGVVTDAIARSRIEIDQARAFIMHTARLIQEKGARGARSEVAQAKVLAPDMALRVIDRAMQFHGGAGLSWSTPLAELWAHQRAVRIGEGADEVHREVVARLELESQRRRRKAYQD
jgi:acyl-CoA dehydrogenase